MQLQHIVVLIPAERTRFFLCGSHFPAVEAASGSGGTATTKSMVLSKNDDHLIRLVNLQPIPIPKFFSGRDHYAGYEGKCGKGKGSEAILWQSQHLETQLQTRRFGSIRPAARPLTICHALDVLQLCDIIQWLTSTEGHRLVLPQMPWGFESHRIEMGWVDEI